MQFIYQPLTWGFFLVLAPLLIHLINLMRHRRVEWAAMEFLLQSHKKNRKWVWLKQLILLLARMAAIALIVAMLAHLVTTRQWSNLFGGKTIHHIILLDDSFSMSDRVGSTSAFDRAGRAIRAIAGRQDELEGRRQKLTLVRFSKAAEAASIPATGKDAQPADDANQPREDPQTIQVADITAEVVEADFDLLLEETRRRFDVTQLAVGPTEAVSLATQLVQETQDEQAVVYVVSDFRADPWDNPEQVRQALERLAEAGAELHLVRCVDTAGANLAITSLQPAEGTRAAGVPLFVDVAVKNFSSQPAEQVQLKVRTIYFPQPVTGTDPAQLQGQSDELPTVLIERIAAGETVTRRVQVYFPAAGQNVVVAELPDDAVATDNRRWCVVDFPDAVPVLVIDGDPNLQNAYFLDSVFQPGERARTGIQPTVQPPAFLRDVSEESLQPFHVVYLLDVDRLDSHTAEKLATYVSRGGGLAVFLGPKTDIAFYNQWYGDGKGAFPVALSRQDVLGPNLDESPDLSVSDHRLFRVLLGQRNPFVGGIRIGQYIRSAADWRPPDDSTIQVLAQLRNRQPLVVERQLDAGRVVVFLTTLSATWNNWSRQPSFVVIALELQSYLDRPPISAVPRPVGARIDLQLAASDYRPEIQFVVPGSEPQQRRLVRRQASRAENDESTVMTISIGGGRSDRAGIGETDLSGIYEAWPLRIDGQPEVRRYSLNVDTRESDLTLVSPARLVSGLQPVKAEIHQPDEMAYDATSEAGFSWSRVLLFGLIGLLLGEQMLAYSASYHPTRGGAR